MLPQLGIPLVFLLPLLLKLGEHVAEGIVGPIVESELERTSFLDTLPHKLVVEVHRWDPLYSTLHRVETADVEVAANHRRLRLRRPRPLRRACHATAGDHGDPFRDEGRRTGPSTASSTGPPTSAHSSTTTSSTSFAATERMPYDGLLPAEGDIERRRVVLTMQQVIDRMAAGDRHLGDLDYLAQKVDVREHQIFQILAVTPRRARRDQEL